MRRAEGRDVAEGGATRVGVLGSTVLVAGGAPTALTPTQRRLLAALVLHGPAGCSTDALVRQVWGAAPPRSARASLHNQLARLRRQLPDAAVSWDGARYRLSRELVDLDVDAFEQAVTRTRAARADGDAGAARRLSADALRTWRDEPYLELEHDDGAAVSERVRLEELHAELQELHALSLLDTGQLPSALLELRRLVGTAPEREGRWWQLISALARTGRRSEALTAYHEARGYFVEELGLDVPAALDELQRRVLGGGLTEDLVETEVSTPLVDRDALVASLDAELDARSPIVLTGEAGLGKSTVLSALADRRRGDGRAAVAVTCLSNPWSALQPIIDLLDGLDGELAALDPPPGPVIARVRALGQAPDGAPPQTTPPDAETLDHEVASVLARVGERAGGLTILVDDAHRGGPTTHRLLVAAVQASTAVRLLAATRRHAMLPAPLLAAADLVPLPPLARDEIRRLALSQLPEGARAGDSLTDWLAELTGGNPLFVTSVLTDLRRRGELVLDRDGLVRVPAGVVVPPQLRSTIEAAIGALGLEVRRALDVAAVLGDPVESAALAGIVPPETLEPAVEAGLLRRSGPGVLHFRHGLLHRVAYDLVPGGRRVELHHAVAAAGRERGDAATRIAWHALAAAELDPAGAQRAAVAAGDAALAAVAHEEAANWYERAVELGRGLGSLDEQALLALAVEAADARRLAGVTGHAAQLLELAERAVELDAPDLRTRAVLAALRLGETGEAGEHQQRAAALARRALDREDDPRRLARLAASASIVHSMSGEPERCRELFLEALALLEDDDAQTATEVLPYAYMSLGHTDDLDAREGAARRLRATAAATGDPEATWAGWHLTFSVALQRGDGELLREAHARASEALPRLGDAGRRWSMAYMDAALAQVEGRLAEAEAATDEALRIGTGVAPQRALSVYAGQLLELRRLQGRLEELVPLVTQLIDQQTTLPAWRAAASMVLATSDPDRSGRLFDALADAGFSAIPRDFTWLASLVSLARGAVLRADADRAARIAPLLRPYEDRVCWLGTCVYGPVATVLAEGAALCGDVAEATRLGAAGVEIARRLGAPPYLEEARSVLAGR